MGDRCRSGSACGSEGRSLPTARRRPTTRSTSFGAGSDRTEVSPHQLAECPWCGEKLDPTATPRHILGSDDPDEAGLNPGRRHLTYCPDEGCEFGKVDATGEGIPVVTVDEDIYRLLPTFIIGTIDKFAQLPWNPNVRMLFGRVTDRCPEHGWRGPDGTYWPDVCNSPTGHVSVKTVPARDVLTNGTRLRPPDLIIQDEFHLITGPLGTLAGLYETAIDELSTLDHRRDHRPRQDRRLDGHHPTSSAADSGGLRSPDPDLPAPGSRRRRHLLRPRTPARSSLPVVSTSVYAPPAVA